MLFPFSTPRRSDVIGFLPSDRNEQGRSKIKAKKMSPVSESGNDESSDSDSSRIVIIVPRNRHSQQRVAPDNITSSDKIPLGSSIPDTSVQFSSG